MKSWTKLGLIAGGGDLPVHVAEACVQDNKLAQVICLKGFGEPARYPFAVERSLGELGGVIKDLKAAECDAVCFAGIVKRPDFSTLKVDWTAAKQLPKAIKAAMTGDDALLRFMVNIFEAEGFSVVGAHELADSLLIPEGCLTEIMPDETAKGDITRALAMAGAIGALDIGQGAIVCEGLVLAVEAQEGTDAMLSRIMALPGDIRGSVENPRGVLAKRLKPHQEKRVDLPVIGLSTIENVKAAGLAGIAAPAGGAFLLGREAVIRAANAAGIFLVGVGAEDLPAPQKGAPQ
ncbi:LpxI family protein [Woodsholea maritima]|uniref:LpxI family protein n=1 Tax=Woodsholea maritima TaxID=240237 RepID=UPI000475A62A|nr:UDP-2,3-diacylglucosamine diphosphatase LpxI [Woodsholea maritima]